MELTLFMESRRGEPVRLGCFSRLGRFSVMTISSFDIDNRIEIESPFAGLSMSSVTCCTRSLVFFMASTSCNLCKYTALGSVRAALIYRLISYLPLCFRARCVWHGAHGTQQNTRCNVHYTLSWNPLFNVFISTILSY